MTLKQKPIGKWYKFQAVARRLKRTYFPSPAEIELIRIMGGKTITIDFIHEPINNFPLCFVVSMGDLFKRERMMREVRVGGMYVDFGNDISRAIEVDGKPFHGDIIREQRRDDYCNDRGWILLHIRAADLYQNPKIVRERVTRFLEK